MNGSRRGGFSLLEVLLATAILLGSAVVLFQLAAIGRGHIESAEDLATAQRIAETRLNEMLAGVMPIESVDEQPSDEDPDYLVTVQAESVEQMPGLTALRITVRREAGEGRRAKAYRLVRWVHLPPASPESGAESGDAANTPSFPPPAFGERQP